MGCISTQPGQMDFFIIKNRLNGKSIIHKDK